MIKKRDEKRIPFRKLVVCKCGEEMHPGFVQDVSQHGIGIQTIQKPSLFNKVRIVLAADQGSLFLDGEVRWAHDYSGSLAAKPREVGIFIQKPPAGYLLLVADAATSASPTPPPIELPPK
jgi:hypothetical protein